VALTTFRGILVADSAWACGRGVARLTIVTATLLVVYSVARNQGES
jgi:hypothetical protein